MVAMTALLLDADEPSIGQLSQMAARRLRGHSGDTRKFRRRQGTAVHQSVQHSRPTRIAGEPGHSCKFGGARHVVLVFAAQPLSSPLWGDASIEIVALDRLSGPLQSQARGVL